MTREQSSAPAHPPTEDLDHLHACDDGVVYIGHVVVVADDGEEEVYAAYPCRRCQSAR